MCITYLFWLIIWARLRTVIKFHAVIAWEQFLTPLLRHYNWYKMSACAVTMIMMQMVMAMISVTTMTLTIVTIMTVTVMYVGDNDDDDDVDNDDDDDDDGVDSVIVSMSTMIMMTMTFMGRSYNFMYLGRPCKHTWQPLLPCSVTSAARPELLVHLRKGQTLALYFRGAGVWVTNFGVTVVPGFHVKNILCVCFAYSVECFLLLKPTILPSSEKFLSSWKKYKTRLKIIQCRPNIVTFVVMETLYIWHMYITVEIEKFY